MEPIPGSATEEKAGDSAGIEALNTSFPLAGSGWWSSPRWAGYGGKPPMTAKRTAAIAAKRAGVVQLEDGTSLGGGEDGTASKKHAKPKNWLQECASASELLAGFRTGSLFAYPLNNRRGKEHAPTTSTAAKWRMRSPHVRVLEVIAAAMIGLGKRGVVISYREMAKLAASSGRRIVGLEERQLGTVMRELCAWGLLRNTPVFVPRGAVTSQRGSCYRLTTLCMHVYRLKLPAACGDLPDPILRELPAKKSKTGSGPDRQSLPANPETPLRGISPEEHEAFPRTVVGSPSHANPATRASSERFAAAPAACAVSTTSGLPSRAIAARGPAGVGNTCEGVEPATRPTNPPGVLNLEFSTRTDALSDGSMSRETRTPLLCPTDAASANDELELAERRVGDAASAVRRGEFDERYVEGDPRETARRLKLARARVVAQEKAELAQRAAAQQELVRERENARRNGGGGKPLLDRDDERAGNNPVVDEATAEMLRRYKESTADEDRELARTFRANRPVKVVVSRDDDELADTIERAWASRFGGEPTVTAQMHLAKIRGGKS